MDVLFSEITGRGGDLGIITLNRPAVLNALNPSMILAMHTQLQTWEKQSTIKAIVIQAAPGRAFCAGGDVRLVYEKAQAQDPTLVDFFCDEYELNRYIYHYSKPYIALLNGITMGGGAGISIHGSHRVATENLIFAMPETAIGFFPDVGATYFLPRLPDKIGYYLGLIGTRLHSDDCVAVGLAQVKIASNTLPELVAKLAATPFSTDAKGSVTNILQEFHLGITASEFMQANAEIAHCFSAVTIEAIAEMLQQSKHPVCHNAAELILKKSPLSLKVTLAALNKSVTMSFDACIEQEKILARHFATDHDFFEGIRAAIVDKDHAPKWQPPALQLVTQAMVNNYFRAFSAS